MTTATLAKEFVVVGKVGELKDGMLTSAQVKGKDILLARVGDKYYAAEKFCPHMGANLSQGKLDGTIITCPRHGSKFDLIDGKVLRWTDWTGIKASVSRLFKSPRPLVTYPVKVEGDSILVQI